MKMFKPSSTKIEEKFKQKIEEQGLKEPKYLRRTVLPSLQTFLDVEKRKIEKKAELDAVDTAKRNRPREKDDQLAPYIQYLAEETSVLCNKVQTELQAEGLPKYKEHAKVLASTEIQELNEQKGEIDNRISNKTRDMRSLLERDIYGWGKLPLLIGFILICLLGDIAYNAKSLQALGMNYFESMLIIVPIVGGLAFAGHLIFKELRKDETRKRSKLNLFFGVLIILLAFAVMGYFRVSYLNSMTKSDIPPFFGTATFVLMNIIIFSGISFAFHYFPTEEQSRIRRGVKTSKKELKKLESARDAVAEEIKLLKRWLNETLSLADEVMAYHNDLLDQNIAFYRKVVANWKREITTRLPFTPDCLSQPIPRVTCRFVATKNSSSKNRNHE